MRIYLIGYMASGKTVIGKKLAAALDVSFADLDELIEATAGASVSSLFQEKGEGHFRKAEQAALHNSFAQENVLIACGGGTPCFEDNMDAMNRAGTTVWLNTAMDTIYQRLLFARQQRPLLAGVDDAALRLHIEKQFRERLPFYSKAQLHVDPQQETIEQLAGRIKKNVNK